MLYRVHWRSRIVGVAGYGNPIEKALAEAWAEHENAKWPEIDHWIEPA